MIQAAKTHGDLVCQFIQRLTLSGDYLGKPFRLQEWQRDIVHGIFDSLDDQGVRQVRECGIWLPRKNGKNW